MLLLFTPSVGSYPGTCRWSSPETDKTRARLAGGWLGFTTAAWCCRRRRLCLWPFALLICQAVRTEMRLEPVTKCGCFSALRSSWTKSDAANECLCLERVFWLNLTTCAHQHGKYFSLNYRFLFIHELRKIYNGHNLLHILQLSCKHCYEIIAVKWSLK